MKTERTTPASEQLAPYEPGPGRPWGRAEAAHLLRRAGFGGSLREIDRVVSLGPERAVSELLAVDLEDEAYGRILRAMEPLVAYDDLRSLQGWWLYRMLHGPFPLLEKMTLFWHGHFATSNEKVRNVRWMWRQNLLLTRGALGRLGDLVLGISKDPAMIRWLDNDTNWKDRPNENYARELMELFTLGVGHYTEADIREAARAFSG